MTEIQTTPDDTPEIRASDIQPSWSGFMGSEGARASEALMLPALNRMRAYQKAESGEEGLGSQIGRLQRGEDLNQVLDSPRHAPELPADEVKTRVKQEGLEGRLPHPSTNSAALELQLQEAHEARDREVALARGPNGFVPGALGLVTSLGVGMIDPVNVAAFSIPVVGEARAGMLLARAGDSLLARGGVKAGIGAAQGAAGGAALVPAEWWLKTQDGQDYTMSDALSSVLQTAGMGAAFHAGFGSIGDLLRRGRGLPLKGSVEDLQTRAIAGDTRAAELLEQDHAPGITAAEHPLPAPPEGEEVQPSRQVYDDALEQLTAAGMSREAAQHNAAVVAARYDTRAGRLNDGRDAFELYKSEGLSIRRGESADQMGEYPGRAFAQPALVDGVRVDFPDEDHVALFDLGRRLDAGEKPADAELQKLFDRFKGHIITDPKYGEHFRKLSDVRDAARDYFNDVREHTSHREPFAAGDVIEPDLKADWFKRALDEMRERAAATPAPPIAYVRPRQLRLFQSAKPKAPDLFAQREAEGQQNLPGTERIGQGELAQRAADRRLLPKVAQKPMDVGLFSDESKQKTLFQSGPGDNDNLPAAARLRQFLRDGSDRLQADDVVLFGGKAADVLKRAEDGHYLIRIRENGREVLTARSELEIAPLDLWGHGLFQGGEAGAPRGRITLAENRAVIDLFAKADRSTFMHEAGHLWLEEMIRDGSAENAPQGLKDDLKTILDWLGVAKPQDITTEHHEQWARAFEQYLAEGKAPSSRLAQAFEKFKEWLTSIYHSLASLNAPLSDDVRGVMDRMLASDKEIAEMRNAPPHPAEALADLPPAAREDAVRAATADVIAGRPVRAGEMLAEAAKEDPRIAESLSPPSPFALDHPGPNADIRFAANRAAAKAAGIDNTHDVVSGANSSRDPNGPVYIDRRIPQFSPALKDRTGQPADLWKYLTTHEREEAKAMAAGMSYDDAHAKVATPAERAAVEADGVDWKGYTHEIDGYLASIEHEKAENPPPDTHVDPQAAIGHHRSENKAGAAPAASPATQGAPGETVTHMRARAATGPRARPEATWSLFEYLASRGGIRDDDPLVPDLRSSLGGNNRFVPGFGNLIRKPRQLSTAERMGGKSAPMSLDQEREAAVEAGYLFDVGHVTGAQATTTIRTLLDAADREARGNRVYREGREGPQAEQDPAQREHEMNGALDQALEAVDIDPAQVSGKLRDRAIEIMDKEHVADPVDAYERAVMEVTEHGSQAGEHERIAAEIPGWDVPDDAGAAPRAGGAAAAEQEPQVAGARGASREPGQVDRAPGRPAAGGVKADFKKFGDVAHPVDDPDLASASKAAEKTPEPPSTEPAKAVSAAQAAAAEAEKLLADILPTLSEEERAVFETALRDLDQDRDAREQIVREGAACLAAAVA